MSGAAPRGAVHCAIGTDGRRPVVCGLGPTIAAAESDAETLTEGDHRIAGTWLVALISEEAAARARAGDVDASRFVDSTPHGVRVKPMFQADP